MSNRTKNKYAELIMDIAAQESFKLDDMRIKHKVSTRVFTVMRSMNIIKKVGGGRNAWCTDAPTQAIINLIAKQCRQSSRIEKVMAKQLTPQLTIKPLKRVERIAPVRQPVQELEQQHTPYPIMDIVIAFLAGIVAAGFISLIWK